MYRDVMLAITQTPGDEQALQAATGLCRALDARLSVSVPFDLPMATAAVYGATPIVLETSFNEMREEAAQHVARIRSQLQDVPDLRFDVHLAEAQVYASKGLLALEARYHDVVLIAAPGAQSTGADNDVLHTMFASLVMEAGRPVMTIPNSGRAAFPPERVVIGWHPTPEATRAVHDALPLLEHARRVDIVLAGPYIGERRHGQEPGADIAAHLARHGVVVEVMVHRPSRGPVANDLLLSVTEAGADLLVVGAYGHSRAREWAFGGVTRELLERADVPVFFSH